MKFRNKAPTPLLTGKELGVVPPTRPGYTGRAVSSGHTGVASHTALLPRCGCHLVLDPTVRGVGLSGRLVRVDRLRRQSRWCGFPQDHPPTLACHEPKNNEWGALHGPTKPPLSGRGAVQARHTFFSWGVGQASLQPHMSQVYCNGGKRLGSRPTGKPCVPTSATFRIPTQTVDKRRDLP